MAGWLVAIAYLVCVATPGLALALGSGPAPCLTEDIVAAANTPIQEASDSMLQMDGDQPSHHHHAHEAHHHSGGKDNTARHHHGMLPGPCCAMMCVSAIPADLPALAAPSRPVSLCALSADQSAPDNAPPLLYRPPIA